MCPDPLKSAQDAAPVRELTAGALLAGCGIGIVIAIGNVYMSLKTGFWDTGNITAAMLGFAIMAPICAARRQPYTGLENNITQTVASAVAAMPAAVGLLGAVPALALLGYSYAGWSLTLWGLALGVIGVLIAIPLRRSLIEKEALPFPTGIATAEVITSIHAAAHSAFARARALFASAAGSLAFVWFREGTPALIPQMIAFPGQIFGLSLSSLTLGIGLSPMMVGAGILIGPLIGVSLLIGATLAWGILAPILVHKGVVAQADYSTLVAWLTWPGVALMVSSSMVALVEQGARFVRVLADLFGAVRGRAARAEKRATDSFRLRLLLGLAAVILTGVLGWVVFGMHPLFTALALLISIPMTLVCCRAAGQTDFAPYGSVGQLSQAFAGMVSASPVVNLATSSIVGGVPVQAAGAMWTYKTGFLVGASPRKQTYALLIGVAVGSLISVPVYLFVTRAYGIGSEALPAQYAVAGKALAGVMTRGRSAFPPFAAQAAAVAFASGIVLSLLGRGRRARYVPSALAMGAGFIAPAYYAFAICLGAFLYFGAKKISPEKTDHYSPAIAGGVITGESIMGVLVAALKIFGVLK